ncbi:DivIVA domain-containing protein [Streptomyces sp. NPDC006259]|uniref:DivIVA domain-containing protein n=1 Tax=Streptomyces sp. NPDC006259 TaxID=3364740 RepID=UPI00368978D6
MTEGSSEGAGNDDGALVAAYWDALHDFADELNALHISCGAPSYRDIAKASGNPKLSQAGITEFLKGRRLPQLNALMEFIRVVGLGPHAAAGDAVSPETLEQEWRTRWTQVRSLQRQAQAPLAHLKTTVKTTLEEAEKEAETLRTAARADAVRIRADAKADADRLTAQARNDAEELVEQARERAERVLAEADAEVPPAVPARRRPRFLRPAASITAVALTVSASVLGVALLNKQPPGSCRSAQNMTSSSTSSPSLLGLQPVGAAAREQAVSGRLPQSFITGGVLPLGFPTASWAPASETPAEEETPASAAPSVQPSSPSASPSTARPSTSRTASADGCQ